MASEKFDVNCLDENGNARHFIVKNTVPQIEKFLDGLPQNARIVAEHTGVYGDALLMLADLRGIAVSYVSGYEIKHSMGLSRGKSDSLDAARIREYGERNADKLTNTHFPSTEIYKLRELHSTRRILVQQRKQLLTIQRGDAKRPIHCDEAEAVKKEMVEFLDQKIAHVEDLMCQIIESDPELSKSYYIAKSIPGIGAITSTELIIKTDNFKRVPTAKKCATLAGISPWPNSTGKSDKGTHISNMGDKELKMLLYICAKSAVQCSEKMRLYKVKKCDIEKKHYILVLNNVANRLLKILYAMIKKGETYDSTFLPRDPRLKIAN